MSEATTSIQNSPETKVYVPPHLRSLHEKGRNRLAVGNPKNISLPQLSKMYDSESIISYYWPSSKKQIKDAENGCQNEDGKQDGDSIEVQNVAKSHLKCSKSLHDSEETPGKLTYILLFPNGNPRWEQDRVIFVKSNLELLKPYTSKEESIQSSGGANAVEEGMYTESTSHDQPFADRNLVLKPTERSKAGSYSTGNNSPPIPVFSYCRTVHTTQLFRLVGHFQVLRVELLEPHSAELERMMLQKWGPVGRRNKPAIRLEEIWEESFSRRWAVVQLVAAEEETKEHIDVEERKGKEKGQECRGRDRLTQLLDKNLETIEFKELTVTQMLQKLRMTESAAAATAMPERADKKECTEAAVEKM